MIAGNYRVMTRSRGIPARRCSHHLISDTLSSHKSRGCQESTLKASNIAGINNGGIRPGNDPKIDFSQLHSSTSNPPLDLARGSIN